MSRTVLLAFGLIGLIACGGSRKQVARAKASSATASRSAHSSGTKASAGRHKGAARADTTTQKNPLTNH